MLTNTLNDRGPLVLAIETATRAGSVAVSRGAQILSKKIGDASISHSSNLIEIVDAGLKEASVALSDVELFAVAVGPGSFTGLRIGLATVKAFAECNDRPVIGVSTLAAIAHASRITGAVVAILPAGRGEVFAQMFSISDDHVHAEDDAGHLSPREAIERYGDRTDVHWAGEGLSKIQEYISDVAMRGVDIIEPRRFRSLDSDNVLAVSVIALALDNYRLGKTLRPEELHAVYVRPSDAEINERWQQQKQPPSTQA